MSMMQPLSGESSVLGICLISGEGLMSILHESARGCRVAKLNPMLALIGAQPDRFLLQIMLRANQANGPAFRSHQYRVRFRNSRRPRFYSAQQRAVTDAGRAKDDVLAVGQIVGRE